MLFEDLQRLINSELDIVAFFQSEDESEAIINTICAFANTGGGYLVFGVFSGPIVKGESVLQYDGIWETTETIPVIEQYGEGVLPAIQITVARLKKPDGKTFLVATVPDGGGTTRKTKDGKVWRRAQGSNVTASELTRDEITYSTLLPGEYRTPPGSTHDRGNESQVFVPPAGVPPEGLLGGHVYETLGIARDAGAEPDAEDFVETVSAGERNVYDDGGGRLPFELHESNKGFSTEGGSQYSPNRSDEADSPESGTKFSSFGGDTELSPPEPDSASGSALMLDEDLTSPPSRVLLGTQLQISREASASEEALNCENHAHVLAGFFNTTTDDVCFGLFGHWGRGKTYLINKVSRILQANSGYSVIRFSAWKYRSTPEVWAHLYETVATASRAGDIMMKILAPYRIVLARYGIWPTIIAYLWFAFSLFSVHDKLWLGQVALQLLGFTGVAYFAILFLRLQGFVHGHAGTLLQQPSHREKLGLQGAIGTDLRALLIGWVPKNYWLPFVGDSSETTRRQRVALFLAGAWERRSEFTRNAVLAIVYFLAIVFVFMQLAPENSRTLNVPFYGKLDSEVPHSIVNLVYAAWILFAVVLPGLALFMWQGPRRLLLVVDDLDRCEPVQMLEIIESVMLLLDDKEIQRRLQIVMLVEEEALHAALLMKYGHLRSSGSEDIGFDTSIDDRIIRENIEKLFVSYLRLPEIPPDDFQDLLTKYMHGSDGEVEFGEDTEDGDSASPATPPTAGRARHTGGSGDPSDPVSDELHPEILASDKDEQTSIPTERIEPPENATKPAIEYAKNLKLSGRERRLLQKRLEVLRGSGRTDIRWGPRTVRCYIHKYRLARALWIALHPNADFAADALLNALIPVEAAEQHDPTDPLLKYIVAQVR